MKKRVLSRPLRAAPRLGAALCIATLLTVSLTGCLADREAARQDIEDMSENTYDRLEEVRPKAEMNSPLIEDDSPWFGASTIPAQTGDLLPSKLEEDNSLVLTFEEPLTLEQVANRIQAATNIRVMVDRAGAPAAGNGGSGTSQAGDAAASAEPRFLPADGLEVTGGRTVWQGKLSNLLDQIGDRFDAEWKYSGNNIRISQQVVRTFMLHALAGSTDVGGSVKTSSGGDGGLPQQSVDSSSKLALWDEIQKSIDTIIVGKARANYSPATGTITLAGYPSAIKSAEEYLRLQNKLRMRRIAIEARVLSVRLNKANENNFDMDLVFNHAFGNTPFVFSSSIASDGNIGRDVTSGILRPVLPGDGVNPASSVTRLVVNKLGAVSEKVAVEYSGSLVTLSDQPAPLQVATKQAYVARVSGSASDTTSATSLEPGTIDIGLSMNILPRVIEQDRIMLRIALGITDLVNLATFTSGASTVQLPEIDTTGFLQNAVLRSGETLVLAGFERRSAANTQTGVGHASNWLMGGGEDFSRGREIRVLLITANILPEEPVSIITP